jgi:hypothetical protein
MVCVSKGNPARDQPIKMDNTTNEAALLEICSNLVKAGTPCGSPEIYATICRVAAGIPLNANEVYGLRQWADAQGTGVWPEIACAAQLIDSDRDEGEDGNPAYTANVLKLIACRVR